MRCLIYVRVSTVEQDTLTDQIASCSAYTARQGGIVVGVESDKLSGFDAQRPGYQRALKAAREGAVDAVCVWKLDRLGRDHAEAIRAAQELDRLGVKLLSVTEPVDHPFFRDLMFLFAGEASRQTSQRVRLKMTADAREGKWPGRPPVGYLIENRRLVADPRKAPLVTSLFELAATGRYSLAQLRDEVAAMGLRFSGNRRRPGEQPISRTRIGTILRNPAYVGDVVYGRVPNGRFTKRHHAAESDWAICRDAHPPLVDRATFDAIAAVLRNNRRPGFQAGVRGSTYFLTGLLICGDCGSRMYGGAGGSGLGKYKSHQYSCVRGSEYGGCSVKSVGGKGVDGYVKAALSHLTIGPEVYIKAELLLREQAEAQRAEADQQRRNLLRRREEIEAGRTARARSLYTNLVPPDVYHRLEAQDAEALRILDSELRGLEEAPPVPTLERELAFLGSESARLPRAPLDHESFDLEAWQEFARLFIERVIVHRRPGRRSNRWHLAVDLDIRWAPGAEILRRAVAEGASQGQLQVPAP